MTTALFAQDLLEPVSGTNEAPCGSDLEYAPRFLAFMTLAKGTEEQQLGESVIPPKDPNWREVIAAGTELLAQTRDLRIAVVLTRAAIQVNGLAGFAQALALVQGWLQRFWVDLHPRLDADGEYDPLMRSNALAGLCDPHGVLKSLRQSVLIESPVGLLTVGEVERLLAGKPDAQSIVTSADQLARLIADERARNTERFTALLEARQSIKAIETLWTQRLESEFWPDLGLLSGLLGRLVGLLDTASDTVSEVPATVESIQADTLKERSPGGIPTRIETRQDAFAALAAARAYFERHEPSHPAPLLIRRIERMADFSFWDMVKELTPEGLNQLQILAGSSGES